MRRDDYSITCCDDFFFFFSSRRRHTRFDCDWSSDVCSSDLEVGLEPDLEQQHHHPDLGEQLKHRCERVGGADRDHLEKTGAERDARQELAHHGRLAQALERLAGEFPASSMIANTVEKRATSI